MFIAGTPQLYLVFSLAEQMQELEQRLLDAEQRAENAETQVMGRRWWECAGRMTFPDPSHGHSWTHHTDVVCPREACFLLGRGKPAVMC